MEPLFALLVGALFTVAIYLFMSKHIIRVLMGAAILSNGVNLLIFTAGRITREVPPIIGADSDVLQASAANPLPQALVLTAIVIAFSFFAFLLVLGYRAFQKLDTDNSDEMRVAEPVNESAPPLGY
ncbi:MULTISPECIES: Na+/H+ antiporter subunit C [Hoeflea]|jgi:multicomponent Na+:H+ antiporter subunit C|uniref:Na+/H+ antiporter subunit C n=1 Tax=Hoeflea alexandrii TaxID=288436 RepID=A0ABT1CUJ2_9HYPH|nr:MULTISPECIES: Na+/H+ antiporter subunit C [Hoeflea]MBV6651391.1 Na+/H+ antiporter subunit C [Hoeflea sp.]MCO6409863.1 Na+/H+ antiporter subunit C [Hoeflea alexandrii]MCY0152866.1 Na+/H+ antiporter subunit C [Hoeflea alexandrii]VVT18883.1 Na(+)/H(+) antiporter subunit C [Hoeflea sp. EC-HK425]|tara:strand:+ start:132 stop:509 length:378 start_codon:yes stop_codon:yes gene_type:complete